MDLERLALGSPDAVGVDAGDGALAFPQAPAVRTGAPALPADVRSALARIASDLGTRVARIEPLQGRAHVARLVLEGEGGPPSAIAKWARPGTDAESHLLGDWAAVEFLGGVGCVPPPAPRLYGGDRAAVAVVLEDLGVGPSLADLLLGAHAVAAGHALVGLGEALGRMHAATAGRREDFEAIRARLGAPDLRAHGREGSSDRAAEFRRVAQDLGVWTEAAGEDVTAASRAIDRRGPFDALVHGDPCTDNCLVTGEGVRLFDLEYAGFDHALLDGAYARAPLPTCWCVGLVPELEVERFECAYRSELARGVPEARDDEAFSGAMAAAAAVWLVDSVGFELSRCLAQDRDLPTATARQRVLLRCDLFAERAARSGLLEALGEAAAALAGRLRARWPSVVDVPLFPAYRPTGL